jgi:hypothetical protein
MVKTNLKFSSLKFKNQRGKGKRKTRRVSKSLQTRKQKGGAHFTYTEKPRRDKHLTFINDIPKRLKLNIVISAHGGKLMIDVTPAAGGAAAGSAAAGGGGGAAGGRGAAGPTLIHHHFKIFDKRINVMFYSKEGDIYSCVRTAPTNICVNGYPLLDDGTGRMAYPSDIYLGDERFGQDCPNYILTPDTLGSKLASKGIASRNVRDPYAFRSGAAICKLDNYLHLIYNIEEHDTHSYGPLTLENLIKFCVRNQDEWLISKGKNPSEYYYIFHCLFCRSD